MGVYPSTAFLCLDLKKEKKTWIPGHCPLYTHHLLIATSITLSSP